MAEDVIQKSYSAQASGYGSYAKGGPRANRAKSWFENDTVDAWRHARMYAMADPLLKSFPGSSWVTVGDGRCGRDSRYLAERGVDALATDISECLLSEARQAGALPDYRVENAEALSFDDGSFDFVFCKESYHHFPRPIVALYEMIRVSRKGVILIEPNDYLVPASPLMAIAYGIKSIVKEMLRRPMVKHQFETGGNYLYSLSRREMEKVSLGLGQEVVAFQGLNDCYVDGVEFEKATVESDIFRRVRRRIRLSDTLCRLGLKAPDLLAVILFKEKPSENVLKALTDAGYGIVSLPKNPYL